MTLRQHGHVMTFLEDVAHAVDRTADFKGPLDEPGFRYSR